MLSLWVVRHGETDWNTETRVQGWTDIPLNETGALQAARLGQSLMGIPFHRVIASDLLRARRTAEIICSCTGNQVEIDARLRERHFGSAEGMIRKEAESRFPNDAPDAEPLAKMDERAAAFLNAMAGTGQHGRILCVTHGGFVRAILRSTFQRDVSSPPNTSITRLQWHSGHWSLLAFGATNHLV